MGLVRHEELILGVHHHRVARQHHQVVEVGLEGNLEEGHQEVDRQEEDHQEEDHQEEDPQEENHLETMVLMRTRD